MSINDHDSVQKQSLFMDIDIWISYNIHVSGNIFLFDFFSPSNKNMFRPSEALAREEHAGLAQGL